METIVTTKMRLLKGSNRMFFGILMLFFTLQSCQFIEKRSTKNQVESTSIVTESKESREGETKKPLWTPYDETAELQENMNHESKRMQYKFIQSKSLDKNEVFAPLHAEVVKFSNGKYEMMRSLVLEQDIPSIQEHVKAGKFNYVDLVLFYLHRIYNYELSKETSLNTIIALNPNILKEAEALDANAEGHHPIYGMPILLKDNIGTSEMKTTAGAMALKDNETDNAFIVDRLKENGALILGKVNLSEWANFICECPNGQSAMGGQTLNPYGRRVFDTGGSSAGSGTSVAANYAVAAVGTETSGSILSPSGQNSVVGMKPTIGLLSRTGIVPISSTLDTPGPMTKNVMDNGILLDAMLGLDTNDGKSIRVNWKQNWYNEKINLKGKRFGVFKNYMQDDTLYRTTMEILKEAGAAIVEFEPPKVGFDGFISLLNVEMKNDLPSYIEAHVKNKDLVAVRSVQDVVEFNQKDSLTRIPYGQPRLDGILADTTSAEDLKGIKQRLKVAGRTYFNTSMDDYRLDAILSINNYDAGAAAAAEYPALTIPMGYKVSGEPINLTFIGKQFQEGKLYALGAAFETLTKARKIPSSYMQ